MDGLPGSQQHRNGDGSKLAGDGGVISAKIQHLLLSLLIHRQGCFGRSFKHMAKIEVELQRNLNISVLLSYLGESLWQRGSSQMLLYCTLCKKVLLLLPHYKKQDSWGGGVEGLLSQLDASSLSIFLIVH